MKGLKKIALATAVAAAPFAAQADLKALDDTTMGNVTGQAGVTIELETEVSIGEFRYTDEGYLAVNDISIGGGSVERDANGAVTGVSGMLDDLVIDIDVEADGDAFIDVHSISGAPIDFAMAVGSASLNATDGSGDSTLLASNIGIEGNLGLLNIRVDTATDNLIMNVGFNVTDMDMDVDFLGVNVRDLTVYGATYYENGGAVDAASMFAQAQITVGKGTSAATGGDALEISIPQFVADIGVGAVEIGGESIGSFRVDNLAVTNTTMKVYGHQ
ncbi:DUF6160 family protein [Marinobacter nauticus]|uniref:DUF6160 domain-containing protein n=1 Tax=Marinobacter nauticus TaxID=2743 RepID=A0A368UVU5_MARNT|nr:DUF6160 family protein [Marinobacter nauticus]MCG8523092.1 DUF6160 family protein [Pseudomonadales bacterium]MBN8238125.1 hypothetical protein [Marinobacter nauticus]MBW3196468.1 hypothetical protein [Marinobacter nauticus]MBY6181878.1 hypothetical protein [Marinobacter nauticus]RBP71901.1 hypothetical protein DET64_108146 [Marinobacter nauticus]